MHQMHLHGGVFAVEGILRRGLEMELLQDVILLIDGDAVSGFWVHRGLNSMAIINNDLRAGAVMRRQRLQMRFHRLGNVDGNWFIPC
jgi:hypothetical protein